MSRTALVIDNDESTVAQINAALGPLGYSVSSASDAAAGLEMANNLAPSIMLVNLATPGSNGLELCKSIHGTDHLKEVPIILLTLREGKFDPVYVKLYGIVSFLKKPFNDDALFELVNEHSAAAGEPMVEAEPAMEAEAFVETEPLVETFEEPAAAEPVAEAYEETVYAEPEAEPEAFSVNSFEDSDATMAMTVDDSVDEGMALETAGQDEGYEETVTLSDAESDLGDLQESFSIDEYAGEETVALDDTGGAQDESFDFDSTAMMDSTGEQAAGQEEEGGWGDMSASMEIEGAGEDSGTSDHADETWGGMGGDMSMDTAFGEGESGFSATDAFAAAEEGEAEGFDAGSSFDSEGTTAFDSGGEDAFSAGADAGSGFDSEGTTAFDSGETSGDMDIGGFKASKDASPSGGEMAGFDDGGEESAWGDTAVESAPAAEDEMPSFDEEEEAFSSGFEEDDEETDAFAGAEDGFGDGEETDAFAGAEDGFGDGEETDAFTGAEDGFGDGEEAAFDDEDAGFESDFLEETEESAADFAGDDQDYTGLFEAEGELEPEEEETDKKGKKKKKGFKKATPSRSRRALLLLLLLLIAGGGAYQYRDMLPFEIPDIPFEIPDISFEMPDIKIPFIGKDTPEQEAKPARKPAAKKPEPVPERKAAPPRPAPDKPAKAEPKAPAPEVSKVAPAPRKEPAAPVKEIAREPKKKEVKKAKKPAQKTAAGKFIKGRYYIQFGVFGNPRNADILSGQLNRKGFPTIKRKITNSKGKKLTIVLLDRPYKTKGSAEKRARKVTDTTGFDTAVYR